jgi:beta-phosphoglucomutase
MDALITDFDGVMVDSEPLHLKAFTSVLKDVGVELTSEAYYTTYLGLDDHDCFQAIATDQGVPLSEDQLAEMISAKSAALQDVMKREIRAFPGVVALLGSLAEADIPRAICSGALRPEIDLCCATTGIEQYFLTKVTARDVTHGKPDPEGYLKALGELRSLTGRDLQASKCVVFEDSPHGVQAAKSAGMYVIAVTNSYPASALGVADAVVDTLEGISAQTLRDQLAS